MNCVGTMNIFSLFKDCRNNVTDNKLFKILNLEAFPPKLNLSVMYVYYVLRFI